MATTLWNKEFIKALAKSTSDRTYEDNCLIYSFLRGLEPLASLKEEPLRALCRSVRYERHDARETLYKKGEPNVCWYILLSGSVFIDGMMYLPHAGFGKRSSASGSINRHHRINDCYVLEASEMIVVDYPGSEVQIQPAGGIHNHSSNVASLSQDQNRMASLRPQPQQHYYQQAGGINGALANQRGRPFPSTSFASSSQAMCSAGPSTSTAGADHSGISRSNSNNIAVDCSVPPIIRPTMRANYAPITVTKISCAPLDSSAASSSLSSDRLPPSFSSNNAAANHSATSSLYRYIHSNNNSYQMPPSMAACNNFTRTGSGRIFNTIKTDVSLEASSEMSATTQSATGLVPTDATAHSSAAVRIVRRSSQTSNASSNASNSQQSCASSTASSQVTIEDTDHVLGAYGGRSAASSAKSGPSVPVTTAENLREVETIIHRSEVYLRDVQAPPGGMGGGGNFVANLPLRPVTLDAAACSALSVPENGGKSSGEQLGAEQRLRPGRSVSTASSLSAQSHDSGISASNQGLLSGRCPSWTSTADCSEELDLNGLPENAVDSEDEDDESCPSGDSLMDLRDTVRDCLERDPSDRNDDDIQILLEFLQHMPSFANLPQCVKRALCSKMVFAVVDSRGTVVMKDGEPMDSWCVIVNGEVQVEMADGSRRDFHLGDCFGIEARPEQQLHRGTMRTMLDDCQFVLIAQPDYVEIMGKLRENVRKHTDSAGEVVSETERRTFSSGIGEGYVVIKARPDKLVQSLVDERDQVVDPYFVEDFLLVYRTFIPDPTEIFGKMLVWFEDAGLRDKVARLVLLWVNNHFNDFETNSAMLKLLENFELSLQQQGMPHHQQLLNIACSVKSRNRTVVYSRSNRDEILHFSILGGHEKGYGIFVSKVEANSQAEKVGLKRGDQILEANGHSFLLISHQKALEVLRGSTHLSITVKANLLGFKEMLATPDRVDLSVPSNNNLANEIAAGGRFRKKSVAPPSLNATVAGGDFADGSSSRGAFSAIPAHICQAIQQPRSSLPSSPATRSSVQAGDQTQFRQPNDAMCRSCQSSSSLPCAIPSSLVEKSISSSKLGKLLRKIKHPSSASVSITDVADGAGQGGRICPDAASCAVCGSEVTFDQDPGAAAAFEAHRRLRPSRSNPDICCQSVGGASLNPIPGATSYGIQGGISKYYQPVQSQSPEHVLKIYKSDQSFKYLTVYKETPALNVVQLSLQEFGMTGENSTDYALCEVSVAAGGLIKQRRLPDQMQNLAERIALNSRYYLKNLKSSDALVPDELAMDLLREAATSLLQLSANIIAAQLTLQDFSIFAAIEQTEYIDNLFKLQSKYGWPKLEEFEKLVNRETYWVASEVCSERNCGKRTKIIKKFIQVAKHCKEFKNFNSMFAILSGLDKPSVSRLHNTWDKIPNKYKKMHEDLKLIIDPSRNMSKYRQLLASVSADPPAVPLFPILKKDLTFIHEGNKTWVDGMVNFEKLRMIAKEVRGASKLASQPYELHGMFEQARAGRLNDALLHMNSFEGGVNVATMRKHGNARTPHLSRRKLYEQALMVRRVKSYLTNLQVTEDENLLDRMSLDCEAQPFSGSSSSANLRQRGSGPASLRQPSPSPSSGSSLSNDSSRRFVGPKFGAESPHAVQKLMSLVETSRVHRPPKHHQHNSSSALPSNLSFAAGSSPMSSPISSHRRGYSATTAALQASGLLHDPSGQVGSSGQHFGSTVLVEGGSAAGVVGKHHSRSQSSDTATGTSLLLPVDLNAECSSVTPVCLLTSNRQANALGKTVSAGPDLICSGALPSRSNAASALLQQQQLQDANAMVHAPSCDSTDSGHVSMDAYSTSSTHNSPPSQRRSYPPPKAAGSASPVVARQRPPLPPSYSSVQVAAGNNGHCFVMPQQQSGRHVKSAAPQPPWPTSKSTTSCLRTSALVNSTSNSCALAGDEEEQVSRV